ncbi:hypothetical protein AUI06_09040 [archaeon 13_2_20CM_2_52_21]|nr:MAG: hypothetical protein AUI06_09040 [archaeon 13_2_20CM_2_52_21]
MSVIIPTYAISVTFLGRERKRAISERERRVAELEKKVRESTTYALTDPGVVALESEIDSYKKEIKKIKGKVDSLSVYYACFLPLLCFMVSVLCAAYGLVLYTGAVVLTGPILPLFGSFYWGVLAVAFLLIGIVFVSNTLIQVNHAATNPETLSLFRVSFDTGSTAEGFAVSQNVGVSMIVHNWGKEMAEKPHTQFYFPPGFQILAINPNPFAG